ATLVATVPVGGSSRLRVGGGSPAPSIFKTGPQRCHSGRQDAALYGSQDGCLYSRAFTLIEVIGALGVIAVLAEVIAPSIIRRIDRAAWTKETADLNTIADSL